MPTGLGSRKVLTPKSSKAPRRSLPPQAKLIEAASFESIEDVPSSPDIMTQKLQEKVKERKQQQHSSNYNSKRRFFRGIYSNTFYPQSHPILLILLLLITAIVIHLSIKD